MTATKKKTTKKTGGRKGKTSKGAGASFASKLNQLRSKIEKVDQKIISALSDRMKVVSQIGYLKLQHAMPVLQTPRWLALLEKRLKAAKRRGLNPDFTKKMYKLIHDESLWIQRSLAKAK